ncbi:HAD domain-containing protein [Streptomyces sp. V4-01]|uniref:HAD domain-containing protein n=1 Tax=Actinacidiphila polyblastidii TaxID=3110430 RepID=A0ABU7PEY2_9ACTN|nr:HAD domain-containing protein [Streptomyces sp. V4-01]
MIGAPRLTLLFLDVDGPLIPFGATPRQLPGGYRVHQAAYGRPQATANPLLSRIDPAYGPRLRALGCELVWATTWMSEANEAIAPWLGLPRLPVVDWPDPAEDGPGQLGLHWKTRPLVEWADGRDFVWIDDEITAVDRAWVAARHPGRALLHRVDARLGLTDEDFTAVGAWLRAA